jgi:hypothetical protein
MADYERVLRRDSFSGCELSQFITDISDIGEKVKK